MISKAPISTDSEGYEKLGSYVENTSGGTESIILSAGMGVKSTANSPPLPAPSTVAANTGDTTGEVNLTWPRLPGARSFVIQYATDPEAPDADWKFGTTSTKSSATVPGLPPAPASGSASVPPAKARGVPPSPPAPSNPPSRTKPKPRRESPAPGGACVYPPWPVTRKPTALHPLIASRDHGKPLSIQGIPVHRAGVSLLDITS